MRLSNVQPTRLKLEVDVTAVVQFFKYRQGPQFSTFIATLELSSLNVERLHHAFEKGPFELDNHVSWLQEDGLLYVYSDGRLHIGLPSIGTKMFEQ